VSELVGSVTEWAKGELEDCFSGLDVDFEGDFYLEENGNGGYIEGVMVHGRGANIYGQLDVFGDTAHRVAMAIRIESAESIGDLPEGLSDEDEDIRDLAKKVLGDFEELLGPDEE
jgi:hypothetical protein